MGRLLRVLAVMAGAQGVTAEPLGPHIMPVIGVLTQPPGAEFDSANYSLIDASYVHYLESGGAVVVPILFNATSEETEQTFMTISGILFTGGPDKPTDFDRYYATAGHLLSLAMEHDMPLWGTCLGFQMISDLMAGNEKEDILSDFKSERMALPLALTADAAKSRLLGSAGTPPDVLATLTGADGNNVTQNWHHYGVSLDTFAARVAPAGMVSLSTNADKLGAAFVSTMEHGSHPIYATQWHPEANAFDRGHASVNHGFDAVRAMQWMAAFFVREARDKGVGPGDVGTVTPVDAYPTLLEQSTYTPAASTLKFVFE